MATVRFDGVTKRYDNGFEAVTDLDLDVADGEFLVLVGPSGCGKTTTLRMLAGLESVTEGEIHIGERLVNQVLPRDRDIAMVFQSYALYPHMTVRENIEYPLRLARASKAERKQRVGQVAKLLRLQDQLDRKPRQLSGGQRQRVAMGRAMVRKPQVFLMDEPLSNLDAKLRVQMRVDVAELQNKLGVTTVYVTHDQVEAMTMGDRVAILDRGRLLQVDEPHAIYRSPVNLFVATFIGSPAMNLVFGRLVPDGDGGGSGGGGVAHLEVGAQTLPVPAAAFERRPALRDWIGRSVVVGVRPEQFRDPSARVSKEGFARLQATVGLVEILGAEQLVHFSLEGIDPHEAEFDAQVIEAAETDEELTEPIVRRFVARLDGDSVVRVGERIELGVQVDQLHWFDPDTGDSIATGPPRPVSQNPTGPSADGSSVDHLPVNAS
jgi:multiple sugar transport system ATP-binding protein